MPINCLIHNKFFLRGFKYLQTVLQMSLIIAWFNLFKLYFNKLLTN